MTNQFTVTLTDRDKLCIWTAMYVTWAHLTVSRVHSICGNVLTWFVKRLFGYKTILCVLLLSNTYVDGYCLPHHFKHVLWDRYQIAGKKKFNTLFCNRPSNIIITLTGKNHIYNRWVVEKSDKWEMTDVGILDVKDCVQISPIVKNMGHCSQGEKTECSSCVQCTLKEVWALRSKEIRQSFTQERLLMQS